MYRDPPDIGAGKLDLARVATRADLHPEGPYGFADRPSATHCSSGTVERCEEPIACRVDVRAAVSLDLGFSQLVVASQDLLPRGVPESGRQLRRSDDIGEQDRGEHTVDILHMSLSGQELLDLVKHRVLVRAPGFVISSWQLKEAKRWDPIGDVAPCFDDLDLVVGPMQHQGRDLDGR